MGSGHALAGQLAADYPDNPDAAGLLRRVTRERDLFRESTVQRLYDEVKHEVERRNWRRAHSSAVKLLERFSDHRKSEKIRAQFSTIAENAEIEERQEQESRIQELIKARRFGEAVELAEQLMRQFPDSPQAQSLEELLPTLRDKALEEEIGSFKRPGVLR